MLKYIKIKNNTIVLGNLPYNISSQILVKMIKFKRWPPKYSFLLFFNGNFGNRFWTFFLTFGQTLKKHCQNEHFHGTVPANGNAAAERIMARTFGTRTACLMRHMGIIEKP